MDKYLDEHEIIETEIFHKKHLPFRIEDWIRCLISIGIIIGGIASIKGDGLLSVGTVLILATALFIYLPLFIRWKRLQPLKYYITDKRLIIFDTNRSLILYDYKFESFPQIILHENAYNSGYIIIGVAEPTFVRGTGLHPLRVGVNLADHEIVLENIPDVKKTYDLIKSKIIA